ncbi:unnamed protein product [Musa acuminata var. zebrina]
MTLTAAPKSMAPDATLPDAENEDNIPCEYEKIEFPDLKVVNENQMMISEYYGMQCTSMETQCSESLITPENNGNCSNEEAGVRLVESFSSAVTSLDPTSSRKIDTPVSNGSTTESTYVLSAVSSSTSHALSATVSSPSPEHKSPQVTEGEADSSAQPNDTIMKPIININVEPEQTVVQQDIVDMYMKSMQQFTESLANMKLPMDVDDNSATAQTDETNERMQITKRTSYSSLLFLFCFCFAKFETAPPSKSYSTTLLSTFLRLAIRSPTPFPFSSPFSPPIRRRSTPMDRRIVPPSSDAHVSLPMESRSMSGEIHVILGPMFAGKTTALLRRIQIEMNNGRSVAMIKSDKDHRYGLDSVVTHDGVKMPCFAVSELLSFRDKLGAEAYNKLDVIGIDEAQFFEDLYDFCNAADCDGKTVVVAGLDGDYLRKRFGSVLDVVPLADSVMKLTARCEICGRRASFTLRKTNETQTELIGGADVYMPVCRQHYVAGGG